MTAPAALVAGLLAGAAVALALPRPVPARSPAPPAPAGAPRSDRRGRLAAAATTIAVVVLVDPRLAPIAAGSFGLWWWWRGVRRTEPALAPSVVVDALPEVVDLIALATSAGSSLPGAIAVAEARVPAPLRPGLGAVSERIRSGDRIDSAVATLTDAWGDAAGPLVHAVRDHLHYGTALGPAIERISGEVRANRRRRAEARARRLPVLLLFPLVLCILPAFGLLTVAPLVASTLDSLEPSPLEAHASDIP